MADGGERGKGSWDTVAAPVHDGKGRHSGWQRQGHFQLVGAADVRCDGGGNHLMRFRPRRSASCTSAALDPV